MGAIITSASDSSTHSAGMSSLNHAGVWFAQRFVIASRAERGEAISRVSEGDSSTHCTET
ncbi:hypothetical protein A6A03_18500 [Chloroflexus islandicus]|uniref:Uncharacterized protein n=1 Tax=Chloroflexus islandicus TaxID=1707952 RepID=A0A178M6D3_9CHLR|nr:hypothetical protein A6A03_18500 [Chloroflexus islandicus]